ncbi:MAG: autotransporter-associated N-terminal domain-containing protein [Fusobacterium periodonticum]|nr:autotransporter-associated N-terminal domain-containing protein [Fusobacterium periodonticum]
MENNLHRIEKDLRSIAKRYKSVKYSIGLAILFLMLGVSAFSEEVNTKVQVAQIATREELKTSVGDVQTKLNVLRNENKKEIENSKLELIQLMEQGDQVVKSPWASWQFGVNYFHEKQNGEYKGRGDKPKKYVYNAEYQRGDWKTINASDGEDAQRPQGPPLLVGQPGGIGSSSSLTGQTVTKSTEIYSSVNGKNTYGLVDLRYVKEKPTDVEIFAKINPKKVEKAPVDLPINIPAPPPMQLLDIKPKVNVPEGAPKITPPEIGKILIEALSINAPKAPKAPTINVNVTKPAAPKAPTINVKVDAPHVTTMSITPPEAVNVVPPNVVPPTPVAFSVAPTIDSTNRKIETSDQPGIDGVFTAGQTYDVNTVTKNLRNFFTLNAATGNVSLPNSTINVKVADARAMVIDEPKNNSEFKMTGTINLYRSKNMGIDLQGSAATPNVFAKIVNSGLIEGKYKDETNTTTNSQQIAFGFSNVDASFNSTMSYIINTGKISLNAPQSAGMQLKPEDPHNWTPHWSKLETVNGKDLVNVEKSDVNSSKGRVLMKADNQSTIDVESSGSFGIITVFNPGISTLDTVTSTKISDFTTNKKNNLRAQINLGSKTNPFVVLPGGEIGRSASTDSKWTSGVYNSGTININGDKSVAIGVLHEIQEVKVGGKIDIGIATVTQGANQNIGSGSKALVENAVGIYAAVPTRPLLKGETGTYGGVAGKDIGTKTVEFGPFGEAGALTGAAAGSGTITIGKFATKSIGLLVADSEEDLNDGKLNGVEKTNRKLRRSGSITANTGANIIVNGDSNYGFVVKSESYKSVFDSAETDNLLESTDTTNFGRGINKGTIAVNGTNSIAFALLKGGDSSNEGGNLIVKPLATAGAQGSTAFYGEQGKFTNSGDITVNTPNNTGNRAVLLKGVNSDSTKPIEFTNTASISVQGKGNIGVYAEGNAKFNHNENGTPATNKISVGDGSIGVYVKKSPVGTPKLNIAAPVELAATTGDRTTIGFYSDGEAEIKFKDGFKLEVGNNSIGLFSQDTSKFASTFDVSDLTTTTEIKLGQKSALSYFNDGKTGNVGSVLTKDKFKIEMGAGSTLAYAENGSKVTLDQGTIDTTVANRFSSVSPTGTSLLLATGEGSKVAIGTGVNVTTTTQIGLIATAKAIAENLGVYTQKLDGSVGIYANKSTATNSGDMTMENKASAAIFGENNSGLTNTKNITIKAEKSAGILANDSNATNSGVTSKIVVEGTQSAGISIQTTLDKASAAIATTAKIALNEGEITLKAGSNKSAAILGKRAAGTPKITLSNDGTINVESEESVGINADNTVGSKDELLVNNNKTINVKAGKSAGINAITATITNSATNGVINLTAKNTAGIIAKASSVVINNAKINASGVTVAAPTATSSEGLVGISADASTVTNGSTGEITLDTAYSAGIYGTNTSTIGNAGKIEAGKASSVGIYVEKNSPATNSGTITMKGESSAGIYGDESKIVNETVNGKITIEEKTSAGMYAKNAVAENNENATITVKKESSAGMYLDVDKANITANGTNKGTITLDTGATKSAGILAKLTAPADKVLTVTNEGDINVNGGTATEPSVAISAENSTSTVGNLLVENKKNINLVSEKSIGLFLNKSKAINETTGNINVKGKDATGVYAKDTADFENKGTITVEAPLNEKAVGIFATGTGTKVVNSKDIKVLSGNSVGIFGEKSATVQNAGNIELGTIGSTLKGLIGIFGESKATAEAVKIENLGGTINVNTESSAGMYANNTSGNIANVTLENTGTINVNGKKSAGIYAPKSTVSKVGEINLTKDADGASAVYIEDGGKVTAAETAVINLGTANQNRVAYYVKNASSNVEGTNIGKIMGYGVGLYLQGAATSKAALNANTATLDYTANGATGNGIIGLYLAGDTDISTYNKAIKVGDTNGSNYAIGIYTDAQKDKTSAYNIMQNITAGKAGVGIFADKGSILKYTGTMKVGENGGTDASSGGVGIYVANQGGAGSNVTLDSTANIELYGKGGVGAIVTDGSTFTANTGSKIELKEGSGVGVYGLKGSIINAQNLVFINNGHQAEKIRTIGGQAHITADETLASGIVLTHVINGETSLASGKTITASGNNIGLMAEGIKDPAATPAWKNGDYEVLNKGILNFSNAIKSTAIYAVSSRAKNEGSIEVGNESTGIYGEYDKNTPKYDGTTPNKSLIETTATSSITLKGNESTGIYLKNLKDVENKGSISAVAGKIQNIGIYAINDGTANDATGNQTLNLKNTGAISLGDASVAIYSKGESDTLRNKVENTGDITVGKKLTIGGTAIPSVGIYAENTDVKTNSTITVGENGIGFYGKNSEIEAKGTANFSNKGILAYLIDSKFTSYLGNLSGSNNTMLFIKNSQVNLAGNGTPVDVTVDDDQTGMYIEGTSSTLTGVRNINLGKNSTGIYLKDTNFTSTADKITSTSQEAKGIIAIDSTLTNNSKIDLSGDNSIGIYSEANNTKTVTNNGKLNIAGKQTLGVFLKGSQTFVNTADIDVADTTSSVNTEKTIGIYTKEGTSTIKHNSGTINVGKRSIGIFSSINSAIELANPAKINVKDEGIGIYKENGTVSLAGTLTVDPHTATTPNSEPVGLYARNGVTVTDNLTSTTIGEKSYGIILNSNSTPNVYTNTSTGNVELGNDSVYLYSEGNANITNNRTVAPTANANRSIAFYVKGNGIGSTKFVNNGNIDLSVGKGTIGVYAPNAEAINKANITVGRTDDIDPTTGQVYTDRNKITYAIGMATADRGKIYNEGNIILTGNKSLGMYGDGEGTVVENSAGGKIILKPGATATATDKITNMTGVLVNNGATFINKGDITTDINYSYNPNVSGLIGVAILNGSKLENHGNITIDADNSYGIVIRGEKNADGTVKKYAEIKNYGNITVRGTGTMGISWKDVKPEQIAALKAQIGAALKADPGQNAIYDAGDTNKGLEGVDIKIVNGQPIVTRNGVVVPSEIVNQILVANNVGMSDIGFYIDTLGATKPIDINMSGGTLPPINSQLIVGTEYSKKTNSKQWYVTDGVIQPFLNMIAGQNFKLSSIAGSLTWIATPVLDSNQNIVGISMAKIPYTAFVEKTDNAYNFTDGLEQRYDMNALDSREKEIFNKLNGIGKNEGTLLSQAYDEMMGHQYANTQQRIQATGKVLDKEFSYLKNSWSNPSKDSNKVKTFGMSGEYKTDTAGIIDYKNNAYGVAYVHEDETVRLGESTGWYAGIVHNTFKFKDIGNSKEEQLQAKVGAFKSIPFDYNNSLNWTISGDIFVGYNKMHRKFLVVDEVFNAKSKYNTYGIGIKNEIGKEFRLSEGLSVRPYGVVKVEYGRVSKIKEKSGEMKLEVKSNDYLSVKPEIGTELAYKLHLGNKTLRAALAVAYENELGRVANGKNKARVAGTSADWFNIRGEKEDRRGNVKTDLNVGVDNQRIGVTGNIGYDTKGRNVRGGLGLRVIF